MSRGRSEEATRTTGSAFKTEANCWHVVAFCFFDLPRLEVGPAEVVSCGLVPVGD
jgi:hypothetical protein